MKISATLAIATFALSALAQIQTFPQNKAGFMAAAGNPPMTIDFETLHGVDLSGLSYKGVRFISVAALLHVVRGNDTFTPGGFSGVRDASTNRLFPTSGEMVVSPGGLELGPGSNPPIERDSMTIEFRNPLRAFGFDHLSQSADGVSGSTIRVVSSTGSQLFNGAIPVHNAGGGGGAPGAADFWGIVSATENIKRIEITESDGNSVFPDCNIGYDSFHFFPIVPDGDTNSDGCVDDQDLALVLEAFGGVNPFADVNEDGIVDDQDLAIVLESFGLGC